MLRLLFTVFALCLPVTAKQTTLRIPLDSENIAVVTFDDARLSAADLKRWMRLDEHGPYSTTVVFVYQQCKTSDIPKLEQDIEKARAMVAELDPNSYPPELSHVVMYLKDLQSVWLWLGEQELEFLKSGKAPENEYKDANLERCQVHTETVPRAQACHQVFFNWHNCANDIMHTKLGSYPKEQWKAFLGAYGIQERLESTVDD